jgi:hypothetical protein
VFMIGVSMAIPPTTTTRAAYGDRITISNGQFFAGGQRIWMNGVNTPWNNWNDFGGNYDASWWSSHFDALRNNKINSVRVWITCNGDVGINIDGNGYVSGATQAHWDNLDSFFGIAQSKGIYIMATLISFDHFKSENANHQRWRSMVNSNSNIDSYVNNYLSTFLSRYKNNPYLWSIDLINEPEWATNTESGVLSWDRMQSYFARTSKYIHENSNVLVTVGLAMVKYNGTGAPGAQGNKVSDSALQAQVNSSNARLDFYSVHWYPWQLKCFGSPFDESPADYGVATDKLNMVGEGPAKGIYDSASCGDNNQGSLLYDMAQAYEAVYNKGWQGYLAWTSNGVDSFGSLDNDIDYGTTTFHNNHPNLVYPGGGSSPTNTPAPTFQPPTNTPTGSSGNARSGSWAARLNNSGGDWKNLFQQVWVSSNTSYTAGIYIKGSGQVDLVVHADAWGTQLASTRCTANGSYNLCSVTFNSGGNGSVGFRLTNGTSGQDMYLDDAFLNVSGGSNLVQNSSFESGSSSWSVESPFSVANVGGGSSGPANARNGTWAARLTNSTGNWKNLHQQVSVSGNTSYTASIWIKGSGQIDLVIHATAWGAQITSTRCTANGSYNVCSVTFNSGGNSSVGFRLTNATSGQNMYLDDAFLGTSGGSNQVQNAGFESGNSSWYVEAPFAIQQVN